MLDALVLATAVTCNTIGLAWVALAMPVHWRQVVGKQGPDRRTAATLRVLGVSGLLISLMLCLLVDYASMASLVWVMALAAAALAVAFTLAWRPRTLVPLTRWVHSHTGPDLD